MAALAGYVRQVNRHPIGSRDRIGSYARILWWQVQSRLARRPVERRWIDGSRLRLRNGMQGATGNLYFGLFEFPDMAFALHLLRAGDLFVDIGANVGVYTVLASQVRGARTIAFEPAQETLPGLRANIAANGIADRVTVHEVALGEEDGEVTFTVGLDCVNHVATGGEGAVRTVPVRRLDTLLAGEHPAFIKIDVEGFERAVIAGAGRVLADPALLAIEIETVEPETRAAIESAGFVEKFYDPFARALSDRPSRFEAGNRLFVRDAAVVAERLRSAPRSTIHGVTL